MAGIREARTRGGIAYREAGAGGTRTLVFLHGIGGAARAFDAQVATFATHLRSVAWDMPGYGGSEALPRTDIPALADSLAAFLRETGIDAPILVGHSIGGMIAQDLLARHLAPVAGVVLAQTSPAFGRPEGDWQQAFLDARLGPLDRGATLPELAPGIVAELVGEGADPAGVDLARSCMAAVPEASYRAAVRALIGFDRRAALPAIDVPCLVLAGERDTNAPATMMARMAEKIPGAEYVVLPGCGHLANLERPAAFDAALSGFLSRHRLAGDPS